LKKDWPQLNKDVPYLTKGSGIKHLMKTAGLTAQKL